MLPRSALSSLLSAALAQVAPAQLFAPGPDIPHAVGAFPMQGASGDLDGDGFADLVAVVLTQVMIWRGDGDGGFGPLQTLAPPLTGPAWDLQLIDGDGDGNLDIWISRIGPGIVELRGDGTGAFRVGATFPGSFGFVIADVDGDDRPDVVSAALASISVARGLGGGAFAPMQAVVPLPEGALGLGAADLDGDGDVDLVARGNSVTILRNDGAGGFTAASTFALDAGVRALRPTLADVDDDDRPDLVLGAVVFRNDGTGAFVGSTPLATGASGRPASVADVDGDGLLDVLLSSGNAVLLWRGTGGGGFAAGEQFPAPPGSVAMVRDLDGDGHLDVVAVGNGVLRVLHNQTSTPPGLAPFGAGTPSCRGRCTLTGNAASQLGTRDFEVLAADAPASALGFLAVGSTVPAGWDPLGLGLQLHLGLFLPVGAAHSDVAGSARFPLPLPSLPLLAGLTVGAQTFWLPEPRLGDGCSLAAFGLVASRGLAITLRR